MTDTPNFKTWNHDELADWAKNAYLSIQANQGEIEQLRLMISSIVLEMQQVRATLLNFVDPL